MSGPWAGLLIYGYNKRMSGKEPNIKLIPADPMTNTILIIYCVSSSGASVPYKSFWRRVHPKKNKIEQIKYHNGSSYRCSPLDIDSFIETTVYYHHQGAEMSRVVQSNTVKVSRQLKEKRMLLKEPVVSRVTIKDISLQLKLAFKGSALTLSPVQSSYQSPTFNVMISDLMAETEGNQMTFRLTFKQYFEEFLNFVTPLLGRRPTSSSKEIICEFVSDLNRDLILLEIAERLNRTDFTVPYFPITARNMPDRNGKTNNREIDSRSHKSPNRSQASVSPSNGFLERQKFQRKLPGMKSSLTSVSNQEKKKEPNCQTPTPQAVSSAFDEKEKSQERQFLNVFDDEDLEFFNSIPTTPTPAAKQKVPTHPDLPNNDDGPSINLRGSFEELEKSFNSNLNEDAIDRAFGIEATEANKRMEEQMGRLKRENMDLKKQVEVIGQLTKENNSIKRKHLEMKEEVNRLEMERKVILTDKLRCEVNWHKEIQEKEQLKREVEQLREQMGVNGSKKTPYMERSMRTNSFHEPAGHDKPQIAAEYGRATTNYFH